MAERIHATEAARRFSELVNRNDPKMTLKDLLQIVQTAKLDRQFGADLAQIQSEQQRWPA